MDLRHLRCFLVLAEELHFARAAERLHIDQSPLSRTIKELEEELGAPLFVRNTRSTRLTRAGKAFLEHAPRVFAALDQARASVRAVAAGFRGQLCIALSDGITPSRLASLMALCRQEAPEVAIRFSEVPLSQQIKGLHEGLYDAGFAQSDDVGDGILATPAWSDAVHVAVPARHPLLAYERVPLAEVLRCPLVMGDSHFCEGYCRHIEHILRSVDQEPLVAERVKSFDLMMAIVAAGFALALGSASQIGASRVSGIVARPLKESSLKLITYLLRQDAEPSESLKRFIERVNTLESADSTAHAVSPDSTEGIGP
jgi:DNA-binding transcriptional LysR family regulator